MKAILILLLCAPCLGQTVTTTPQTVTTSAPVVPAQSVTITTQKNGGKVTFTIPAQTLKPLTATIPGQTAAVNMSGYSASISCSLSPNGTFVVSPDGSIAITGLTCTVVKK